MDTDSGAVGAWFWGDGGGGGRGQLAEKEACNTLNKNIIMKKMLLQKKS